MEIFNKDTSNPDNIELMDHAKRPLSSHAVLDEGWRDANIYLPKSREIVWLYCKTRVMGILFQTSGYWTIGTSWYEYNGDGLELNVEVIAWRPLPDPPAFV